MHDLPRRLLRDARNAQTVRSFWERATETLRAATGARHVALRFEGVREHSALATDGAPVESPLIVTWNGESGRRVHVALHAPRPGSSTAELEAALDMAAELARMVGERVALERDQRLGNFVVELSRWLLAAPDRDLMLRYTLQSLMKLFGAEGAYAALREAGTEDVRVVVALGRSAEYDGMLLPIDRSTTGRVIGRSEPLITDNVREEPDIYIPPSALAVGLARSAMIVPLQSATGVLGAIGLVRFYSTEGSPHAPPAFTITDLHFFTAVATHLAGGLELTHLVTVMRAAADRAAAMVHASPLPLVLVDPAGRVHLLNEAGRRVLGLARADDAVGHPLDELGVSSAEIDLHQMLGLPRYGGAWHGRVVVSQPGGDRRVCDCTVTDLERLGSEDLLVALYDRTDELRAQREMITREKLATIGEIASGVAHEVNNPLTAIRMEAELLSGAKPDPETEAAAQAIVREVDRAASIVRSLLQLTRRSDSIPTPVQLNDLIHDVAEIRRRVLRADSVDVQTVLDPALPPVLGLAQELTQVIINLVSNAEHAVRQLPPAVIRVATQAREGWARLTVEDSGPGVPAQIRHRIFEPFFSTKRPDEGSGLGLAICQRAVSELGGRIWLADSELGGARFVVELPAAPERSGESLDVR